jgi:hypothetical protein
LTFDHVFFCSSTFSSWIFHSWTYVNGFLVHWIHSGQSNFFSLLSFYFSSFNSFQLLWLIWKSFKHFFARWYSFIDFLFTDFLFMDFSSIDFCSSIFHSLTFVQGFSVHSLLFMEFWFTHFTSVNSVFLTYFLFTLVHSLHFNYRGSFQNHLIIFLFTHIRSFTFYSHNFCSFIFHSMTFVHVFLVHWRMFMEFSSIDILFMDFSCIEFYLWYFVYWFHSSQSIYSDDCFMIILRC